jgi:hypothetical protein
VINGLTQAPRNRHSLFTEEKQAQRQKAIESSLDILSEIIKE